MEYKQPHMHSPTYTYKTYLKLTNDEMKRLIKQQINIRRTKQNHLLSIVLRVKMKPSLTFCAVFGTEHKSVKLHQWRI